MAVHQPRRPQQPRDPLAATADSMGPQFRVNARRPIRLPALGMDRRDPCRQYGIGLGPRRGRPFAPGVVAAAGDAQHATEPGDRMLDLLALHELERHYRRESVSFGKEGRGFFRISRSSRRIWLNYCKPIGDGLSFSGKAAELDS